MTEQCFHFLLGSEWDYVIISLVRSLKRDEIDAEPSLSWLREHLGFLTDEHQMNVGLTRARRGLCIIGEFCRIFFFFSYLTLCWSHILVIGQAWGQDGWIMAKFILSCLRSEADYKHAKKLGQYRAILTEQAWLTKDLLNWKVIVFSRVSQRVIQSGQDSAILNAQINNQFFFPTHGTSHII